MIDFRPKRIVCLTEETTELIYLLGEENRIVGISGFTMRPLQARKEKPKVSLFTEASIDEILKLHPDLVIGFSDIQADIAAELIKKGITVWVNNHRSVEGIQQMILQLGLWLDKREETEKLVETYQKRISEITDLVDAFPKRPTVYFEEWYDPLISGIGWVSEIIELAGGIDIYKEKAQQSLAKGRIIEDHTDIVEKNPDLILVSWCGKKFKKKKMLSREGWEKIEAVRNGEIYEIESEIILQPGPAALTDGLEVIHSIVAKWVKKQSK